MTMGYPPGVTSELPGARMQSRALHFFWLLDCSSSMSVNGKMGSLDFAIRESLPAIRSAAASNPAAELLMRAVTFGEQAAWVDKAPVAADAFVWRGVKPSGGTRMGAAFSLVAAELATPPMPPRAIPPVLVLVSDGQPTDDWQGGLRALDQSPWGRRAVRMAVGIGDDVDVPMLNKFLNNPENKVLRADDGRQLVEQIRWASTNAVRAASALGGHPAADPTKRIEPSDRVPGAQPPPVRPNILDPNGDVW